MNPTFTPPPTPFPERHYNRITGYAEGYYGRLLSWHERQSLIRCAADSGFNFYLYAPKDDEQHRFKWREPYNQAWRDEFQSFAKLARDSGIQLVAGISPGIDFNFEDIEDGADLDSLCAKATQLIDDGATGLAVLFDDIDPDFHLRSGSFQSEGTAHASVANRLRERLRKHYSDTQDDTAQVYTVPRIYANELISGGDPLLVSGLKKRNESYLKDFSRHLADDIAWFYCGTEIVARTPSVNDLQELTEKSSQRVIIWDNFYANDYCPRRLFVGPWTGREACADIVINPTGMHHTDKLLMQIVASARKASSNTHNYELWRQCIENAGVPDAFHEIAQHFSAPVYSDFYSNPGSTAGSGSGQQNSRDAGEMHRQPSVSTQLAAIEQLLWHWKSTLAREWYPYLMGLKQDLSIADGQLSKLRIRKTQNPPLANLLT